MTQHDHSPYHDHRTTSMLMLLRWHAPSLACIIPPAVAYACLQPSEKKRAGLSLQPSAGEACSLFVKVDGVVIAHACIGSIGRLHLASTQIVHLQMCNSCIQLQQLRQLVTFNHHGSNSQQTWFKLQER